MNKPFFKSAAEWLAAFAFALVTVWLAVLITIFLVLPAITPTAHAETINPASAAGPAQDYTCTPHKVLFFTWGWDCAVPTYTNVLTLTTAAGNVWCDQGAAGHQECKTSGTAQLRINQNALAGLAQARHFDLALRCTTTPGQPAAQCAFAIEGRDAGGEK